jgi:hypothetical protein
MTADTPQYGFGFYGSTDTGEAFGCSVFEAQ